MYTNTLTYLHVSRVRCVLAIGLIVTLILTSLALIAGAILTIAPSTTQNTYQADLIPVVQNSITPIPVPTAPIAVIQPLPSTTPTPDVRVGEPSILPLPVPTAPLS